MPDVRSLHFSLGSSRTVANLFVFSLAVKGGEEGEVVVLYLTSGQKGGNMKR